MRTSREVKSGERNLSFSKSFDQGSSGMSVGADSTSVPNALSSLHYDGRQLTRAIDGRAGRIAVQLTMAAKPSHSPRTPAGSRYVSMKPMLLSTIGP